MADLHRQWSNIRDPGRIRRSRCFRVSIAILENDPIESQASPQPKSPLCSSRPLSGSVLRRSIGSEPYAFALFTISLHQWVSLCSTACFASALNRAVHFGGLYVPINCDQGSRDFLPPLVSLYLTPITGCSFFFQWMPCHGRRRGSS